MDQAAHRAEDIVREPDEFARVAQPLALWTGSPWAAAVVALFVAVWLPVGIAADFPRAWELAVTTGVPLLNLGLLIVVQHTQNHDNRAMQLKLDELIRSMEGSTDAMMRVEEAGTDELDDLQRHFRGHVDARPRES